ncbi:MAG: hypothetical protein AAF597_12950, partial [Bacteroidota bacterium]
MTPQKTKSEQITDAPKVGQNTQPSGSPTPNRDRLRDIIVVFITYPLTPSQRASEAGKKHPWLEVLSLLLKAGLAAL